MNENEIENIFEETKKKKKKRKHKKRLINEENNEKAIDKKNDINHGCDDDSVIKNENDENKANSHNNILKKDSHFDSDKIYSGREVSVEKNKEIKIIASDEKKQNSESFGVNLIPDANEMSRSMFREVSILDFSRQPNVIDDQRSQSADKSMALISANRLYQPPTLKSLRSTFSMKIHQNELCNADECLLQAELSNELIKYFPERKAKIMVITWNMAGISTYPESFLDIVENSNSNEMCDIYLLCFQETTSNKQELLSRIQMTLGGHYVIYNYVENGSLLGILVGHKKFIWNLALIGKGSLSTRVTPITKGVVAISFQFFGNTIVFLGSHFSSDKGKNSLRLEDYNSILYSKELIKNLTTSDMKLGPDEKNLSHYFDYTFWAGDLNFRILRDIVTVARLILSEIDQNDGTVFEELLEYDELITNQTAGLIFQEFEEGRIMFLPTYNFIIQTDEYNEKRTPSYTDRILFRSHRRRGIECIHYNSVKSYICSDHKPVCAVMEVLLEPQCHEHLKSSGIFNTDIYTKCFNECEMKQKELITTQSRMCSIQ